MDNGKFLRKPRKTSSRYTGAKGTMQKILLKILAFALISGGIATPTVDALSDTHSPTPEPSSLTINIGVPNKDAEITVEGKSYKIDNNSVILVFQDEALAYDEYGNILKGEISDSDYKTVKQITEEQMSHYDIRQVISQSDANVRSTGEINEHNIISTVSPGDYVLAYQETSPEDDKEWLSILTVDDDGKLCEGHMREDVTKKIGSYEEVNDRVEDNMKNMLFVNTSLDGYIPLKLRSSPQNASKENIITQIPYGALVQSLLEIDDSGTITWLKVEYETPDGNTLIGWVAESYLTREMVPPKPVIEEKKEENLMFVDTSRDDNISLNLRSSPETGTTDNIITKIPHGSSVQLLSENKKTPDNNWVFIRYTAPSGNQLEGWVSGNYLTQELANENIQTNATGNVTGIDVSTISPSKLREILKGQIPNQTETNNYSYNTSPLAGDINYVYIKLGGSGYGKGALSVIEGYDDFYEQVAICEELGMPYGFYYYSTAITEEEAQIELEVIQERLEDLRQKYDMDYNKLEIAVDFELNWQVEKDRQYRGDIEEQTKAKAFLINGLQKLGLSDNVLIYGPGRVMQHTQADQIIDLELLHSLLDNPENVKLWLCSHIKTNGNYKDSLQKDIDYAEKRGFSTAAVQLVLDVQMNNSYIDINNMNLEHFKMLTQNTKTNDNSSHSIDLGIKDDGR